MKIRKADIERFLALAQKQWGEFDKWDEIWFYQLDNTYVLKYNQLYYKVDVEDYECGFSLHPSQWKRLLNYFKNKEFIELSIDDHPYEIEKVNIYYDEERMIKADMVLDEETDDWEYVLSFELSKEQFKHFIKPNMTFDFRYSRTKLLERDYSFITAILEETESDTVKVTLDNVNMVIETEKIILKIDLD